MKQVEITVNVHNNEEEINKILTNQNFKIIRKSRIEDAYLTQLYNKLNAENISYVLENCILIRKLVLKDKEIKKITYKEKKYENGKLLFEEKTSVNIDNIEEAGQIKRKAYQRRLPENPSLDYYYIIRETGNAESVLVEYGFIDNKNDAYKLENNLEDFVEGTVKAIAEYLGVDYVAPNISSNGTYTVKRGDTLYSISREYNIPIDTLISLNNLTSPALKIGQILKLTSDSKESLEDTEIYQVKRGDTLYNIASKFNTTVDNLKNINNLTSNTLTIGQNLLVPIFEDNNAEEDYDIYTVQKGDSLWSISRKYDMPVNELIEINKLTNLTLKIGQQLLVPKQVEEDIGENVYVVQKGDTLWSIANKLNIPVNTIKELNNLTSNLLTIGQQLIIQ